MPPGIKVEKPILRAVHVTLENKPGQLAKAARTLAEENLNVEGLEVEILGKSGFFRFYTDAPQKAMTALRARGFVVMGMEILEVVLNNKPGELARMCETLSKASINIESMFGSGGSSNKEGRMYLRVDKPAEAHLVLSGAKFDSRHHA